MSQREGRRGQADPVRGSWGHRADLSSADLPVQLLPGAQKMLRWHHGIPHISALLRNPTAPPPAL